MMKKIILIIIVFLVVLLFIPVNKKEDVREKVKVKEKRGVFISYIELTKYLKNKSVDDSKNNIIEMLDNIVSLDFNTVYLQIRSFNDAIYKSDIFPWSSCIVEYEGLDSELDVLDFFIKESHKRNVLLYAWINPYRVRTNENIESISSINPAFKYIDTDYLYVNNGIYLNPAKKEVEDLIVNGVKEVVENYNVDGIIFDDYFYPDDYIDNSDYLEYSKEHDITKKDYHLMIINNMVKRVHEITKKNNKLFGISPDGNIDNNYNKNYADVKTWVENYDYIDFIMPQVYYGFYNQNQGFKKVINEWNDLIKNKDIELHIALAFYKVGLVDTWALSGSEEWVNNSDIIMKEVILCRNLDKYRGFSLFRYDYLFNEELYNDNTSKELENLKKILN